MIIRAPHELCNAVTRTQKAIEWAVSSALMGRPGASDVGLFIVRPTSLGGLDSLASSQNCSKLTAKRKGPRALGYWHLASVG
jgi:hypothetical protein